MIPASFGARQAYHAGAIFLKRSRLYLTISRPAIECMIEWIPRGVAMLPRGVASAETSILSMQFQSHRLNFAHLLRLCAYE
jgi:hypothetical protein